MDDPVARFAALVRAPGGAATLDAPSLAIASALDPDSDPRAAMARLGELAGEVVAAAGSARPGVEDLREVLFGRHGFTGDQTSYDDPANSLLPVVLERRRGIPISLSIVTIEVGRRAGVALVGVGMPGHFLVGDPTDGDAFVDPFSGGVRLDREACARVFHALHGPAAPFDDRYLAPTPNEPVLARVLANLQGSYQRRGRRRELAVVLRLRAALPNVPPGSKAELADALERVGAFGEAADALDELLAVAGDDGAITEELTARSQRLRARLN